MTIKVTKYFPNPKPSSLLGTMSIEVDLYGKPFYINKIKLFQKNGQRWINFPDEMYEKDGEKKFFPYCGFCERNDNFQKTVLNALEQFCADQSPSALPKPQKASSEPVKPRNWHSVEPPDDPSEPTLPF